MARGGRTHPAHQAHRALSEAVMSTNLTFAKSRHPSYRAKTAAVMTTYRAKTGAVVAALFVLATSAATAQQPFKSPEEAAEALVSAARSGDRKALLTVLGRDGQDIVS